MNDIRAVFFDLDETIYVEADFKRSGFCAVASSLAATGHASEDAVRTLLLGILDRHGPLYPRAFHDLTHGLELPDRLVAEMIRVFREHDPCIAPYDDFSRTIGLLHGAFVLGVITDGLAAVQRRKAAALGIHRWATSELVLFTDALDPPADKRSAAVFRLAAERAGVDAAHCTYVGDNPNKDFHHPARLGWRTIRIRRGVYASIDSGAPADDDIDSFDDLPRLLMRADSRSSSRKREANSQTTRIDLPAPLFRDAALNENHKHLSATSPTDETTIT